jgi:hypothetical protein
LVHEYQDYAVMVHLFRVQGKKRIKLAFDKFQKNKSGFVFTDAVETTSLSKEFAKIFPSISGCYGKTISLR